MHPYTAHLVGSLPRIGDSTPKKGLSGTPPSLANPPGGCGFHPPCPLAIDICRQVHPTLTTLAANHRVACYAASLLVKPNAEPAPAPAGSQPDREAMGLVQ